MAAQVYTVLYTHQKTKKAKVWQDGILKTSGGQQAVLFSDNGQRLESVYIKTGMVNPGDELESDRYLITVEAVGDGISSTSDSTENKDGQNFSRGALKPIGLQHRAGLKRKITGFQVPREIPKMLPVEETAAPSSHQLAHGYPSQSPQLYATSPLFAAAYGNQEDKNQQINFSSKHRPLAATNPNVRENIFHSNVLASPEKSTTKENVERVVEERVKQNPRSTAQILALLNNLPIQNGSVAAQLDTRESTLCSNGLQRTTSTLTPPGGTRLCELSPIKSRWDVYLETPAASGIGQIDHEDLEVPLSQGQNRDNHAPFDMTRLEKTTDIVENKQLPESHISEPDPSNSRILTPLTTVDFITDDEKNDGSFSEIRFNLMDSFNFAELDDTDSTESQPDSGKEPVDLTKRENVLQNKNEEKNYIELLNGHMENGSLHEKNSTVSEMSFIKAESESTIQTPVRSRSTTAKASGTDSKAKVMVEVNVMQTVEKREFLFPNQGHVSSNQNNKPDDLSKHEAMPKNLDDCFFPPKVSKLPMLTNAIIHHSVRESNKDCTLPERWPSGSSISLLKSLSKPRNALESLNMFSERSTAKNTDSEAQPCLERVQKKGQNA